MQAAGFVTSATVAQAARPDKRIYSVTEQGRTELTDWVGTVPKPAYHRDDFLTMVYSGWIKFPAELKDMFAERKATLQEKLDHLSSLLITIERDFVKEIDDLGKWQFFTARLMRRRIAILREDMSWTLNMLHQLEISIDQD